MGAGDRNRLITIQRMTKSYDAVNQPIETWADSFNVYAKKVTTGSGEFYAAQKLYEQTTAVYLVPYTLRITAKNRIKDDNQIYEILGKPNDVDGKRKNLQIAAKEVV